jgi:hypothetical protein
VTYKVFFRPEAENDMEEAAIWYEQQKPGLGKEFLELVLGQCGILEQTPQNLSDCSQTNSPNSITSFSFWAVLQN